MGGQHEEAFLGLHPELRTLSRSQRYRWMTLEGKRIIVANLGKYSVIHAKGMFFTVAMPSSVLLVHLGWDKNGQTGFRKRQEGLTLPGYFMRMCREMPWTLLLLGSSTMVLIVYYLFVIYGMFGAWNHHRLPFIFMLAVTAYFVILSGGPAATCRFRDPFAFIPAIWAGIGIARFVRRKDGWINA
jgi:hypothetical protein